MSGFFVLATPTPPAPIMPPMNRTAKKRMKSEENQSFSSPLSSMICMPPMAMVRKLKPQVVHVAQQASGRA